MLFNENELDPQKKYMHVIFTRSLWPGSAMIRFCTWSSWGHCGIITPENTVIEACAFHRVGERPLADVQRDASKFSTRFIEVPDPDAGIAWARSQKGKPYDYKGVGGFVIRDANWQDEDAWFCSELVETAIVKAGRTRFLATASRITPQHVWMTV